MNIYTARYANPQIPGSDLAPFGITIGYPRHTRYKLAKFDRALAPDKAWKDCPDKELFRQLYEAKLTQLGGTVMDRIRDAQGEYAGIVLLCYEDLRKPELWCHRRMLASHLYCQYGIHVPELPETSYSAQRTLQSA